MEIYFPCVKIPYRFVTPLWLSKLRVCQRFSVKMIITLLLGFLPLFGDMIGHDLQDIDLFPIS